MKGMITTIQRMSLHDGPGIRSTIFLKGCNFKCKWCHNPETYTLKPELEFIKQKCISCEECLTVDENTPMSKIDKNMTFNKKSLVDCQKYSDVCYSEALHTIGEEVTAQEVFSRISMDLPYYNNSSGGVTISGGEPLMQPEFCEELLTLLKKNNIHTAIETNLSLPWNLYEKVLPNLDLVYVDLKHMNELIHKNWIGSGNERVIENIKKLDSYGVEYILRTPIIPEFNNSEASIRSLSEFISKLKNLKQYEILPYHPLADSKFENLSITNPMQGVSAVDKNEINKLYEIINEYRIPTNSN